MTIEQILQLRNQGEATHLLPYTGAGSGIPRAMEPNPHVSFISDDRRHEFIVTINLTEGQLVPAEEVKRLKERHQETGAEPKERPKESDKRPEETEIDPKITEKRPKEKPKEKPKEATRLDGRLRDIVNFCSVPRTIREIFERLGVTYDNKSRKRYITPLLDLGLLEMTIPETPRHRNQKYRKVKRHLPPQ